MPTKRHRTSKRKTKKYTDTNRKPHSKNGWKIITLRGSAKERGIQHGKLLAKELALLLKNFPKIVEQTFHLSLDQYLEKTNKLIKPHVDAEWLLELEGIVEGALSKNVVLSVDFLIGWNGYLSMDPLFENKDRCSAFIATGNATKDGSIVMAHNTHCDFVLAPFSNIIAYVYPSEPGSYAFCMQTGPGFICSTMDWFITAAGMVGCETTIGSFKKKPEFGSPYFCRIRKCMQYGKSLDQYDEYMRENNAGDYACSWLFGNINTGEIMRLELGKDVSSVARKTDGYFYGTNSAIDPVLRKEETNDKDIYDLKTSNGSRMWRLNQLLDQAHGKLDLAKAKSIIGDHYDSYEHAERPGLRTICKHLDTEPEKSKRPPYYHFGAIDGKVVDSHMAKKMAFWGLWGSSCGKRQFRVADYVKKHPEYKSVEELLIDLPIEPWTKIGPAR